jgi:hypothetical protein
MRTAVIARLIPNIVSAIVAIYENGVPYVGKSNSLYMNRLNVSIGEPRLSAPIHPDQVNGISKDLNASMVLIVIITKVTGDRIIRGNVTRLKI